MTSAISKPVRRFLPILRHCYASSSKLERSYSFHSTQNHVDKLKCALKVKFSSPTRNVSSSNLANSSDTNESCPKDEKKNLTDDVEFQSYLNDFAKDFDVGSDSEQILDEIRKSLDETDSPQTNSEDKSSCSSKKSTESNLSLKEKFKEFDDKDSSVIPSYEELQRNKEDYVYHISQETDSNLVPDEVVVKRGIQGVFDIGEIIEVLKKENVDDIAAISVPKELCYTDFLVIVTAKSPRHSKAVCERVKKLSKMKRNTKDPYFQIEGEDCKEWKVIDMGNIVLHVFLEETRALYDIESLWLFDSAFDRGGNMKDDPLYTAIEQQMAFFNSINEKLSGNNKQKSI